MPENSAATAHALAPAQECCPACARSAGVATGTLGGYQLLRCEDCGHHYVLLGEAPGPEYSALYFAEDYERDQLGMISDRRNWRAFMQLPPYLKFLDLLGPGQGRSLLDVGCGAGRFCAAASLAGWAVSGIDPAVSAIEAGCAATGFPLSTRGLAEVAQAGERFDVVTFFDVLEHLPEPVSLLSAAGAVLKPGGRLFITVPNFDCPLMRETSKPYWLPPVHLQFFARTSLEALVERSQAQVVKQGFISSDPLPRGCLPRAKWLSRRLRNLPQWQAQLWALAQIQA